MIIVTDVSLLECDEDSTVVSKVMSPTRVFAADITNAYPDVERERVTGVKFKTKEGGEVVIGMTREVRQHLGAPFDTIQNLIAQLEREEAKTQDLKNQVLLRAEQARGRELELLRWKHMGFARRLLFLLGFPPRI